MRKKSGKYIVSCLFIIFVIFAVVVNISIKNMNVNSYHYIIYNKFVDFMAVKLVMEKNIPANILKEESNKTTLIYVLGGNQDSLISRFRRAANLYHQGLSKKILILSRPGITEFSQDLGRNLTNNEWAVRELQKFGVHKEDVEPVSVEGKFFGTLGEAIYVTDFVRKKGYSGLILVTSDYHTRRVFKTFSKYASGRSLQLFIYGSNQSAGLHILFAEYLKSLLYDYFLIPLYTTESMQ